MRVRRFTVDRPVGVRHYQHMTNATNPGYYRESPSGIECIDVVEHMNFSLGNAVKYIWRAGKKGDPIEDLEKAKWYIDREIARLSAFKATGIVRKRAKT